MAALHDALKVLSPITAADLPEQRDLSTYLTDSLQATHVLIGSLPPPSGSPCPLPVDSTLQTLHKEWKPVKVGAAENLLGFTVFKLPAKDGRGTWFARRSIHGGLGFGRFRTGLQREFEFGEQRGTSVRGIGRTRRVDWKQSPLGHLEVNHLFAQFPGPTAPRDFVTASLTSSTHPDDIAGDTPGPADPPDPPDRTETGRPSPPPQRQFTMISRPVQDHPECVAREGYVRGQFESVEFIRELPGSSSPQSQKPVDDRLRRAASTPNVSGLEEEARAAGRKRGKTLTNSSSDEERSLGPRENTCPEQSAVEWIMITRSDPGGSVPRWMVERGTPSGIIKDAEKFLDWAAGDHGLAEYPTEPEPEPEPASDHQDAEAGDPGSVRGEQHESGREETPEHPEHPTSPVPEPVSEITPPQNDSDTAPSEPSDDAASCASFATARSSDPSAPAAPPRMDEEKALARLLREKAKLAEKLHRQRSRERKRRSKDEGRDEKLLEKHMHEVEKREARYNKEIERVRNREEKRKGKQNKEVMELKGVVEALTRQNLELIERVEELEGRGRRRREREAEAGGEVSSGGGPG